MFLIELLRFDHLFMRGLVKRHDGFSLFQKLSGVYNHLLGLRKLLIIDKLQGLVDLLLLSLPLLLSLYTILCLLSDVMDNLFR